MKELDELIEDYEYQLKYDQSQAVDRGDVLRHNLYLAKAVRAALSPRQQLRTETNGTDANLTPKEENK